MHIVDIKVEKVALGLSRPYRIAYKTVSAVDQVVVTFTTDNGEIALGTCNPSPQVVNESVDDSLACLQEADLGFLVGQDLREGRRLIQEIARRFPRNPGAAAALDIGIFDLHARAVGLPLCDLLGRQHRELPTSITIGIKDTVAETLAEAEEYVGRGFTVLKLKLGDGLEPDVERIAALRRRFGQKIKLRVDVNQAYDAPGTQAFVQRCQSFDLELIEQPMAATAEQLAQSRTLPEAVRRQIVLDESVCGPADALAAVAPPAAAGGINIKLMKCGGVGPALDIAQVAHHAGLTLMWGCNDESIVSIAAALHAALACPATRFLDLDGSLDLARDVVTGGFELAGGLMRPLSRPGLGVTPVAG